MTKWADYLISAVRFNTAGTHITALRTHVDDGLDQFNNASASESRGFVLANLAAERTYATTVYKASKNQWEYGAPLKALTIGGTKYLKTVADRSKRDNLDNLPNF